MTTATTRSRHLLLQSIDNIRDLGGLETSDGYRTREGKLFRSSFIHDVSAEEADLLANKLGLRLVIDLRSHGECAGTGRGLLARHVPAYVNLPIFRASHRSGGAVPETGASSLFDYYLGYLEHSASQIAMAVRMLASDAHLPALFHCAAGKDRTGTLAAVLLDAIGVRHDQIVADYALTRERLDVLMSRLSRTIHYSGMMQDVPAHAIDADPATMQALLDHLQEHHGGAAGWLRRAGVEQEVIERLRRATLE